MDVSFAIGTSDDERRAGLYRGEIIVLPATPASLELVRFARKMIEDAFAPYSPRTAYQHLEVTETEPGLQGDRSSAGTKPATLETGAIVQVPLFVNQGERIRVDTRTGAYIERA